MHGEIGAVWPATWSEIWAPLMRHPEFGNDLVTDLFREHIPAPTLQGLAADLSEEDLAAFNKDLRLYDETATSVHLARKALRRGIFSRPVQENVALDILERSFFIFESYGDGNYANEYFGRVDKFLRRYSLRYDLRRPLTLHPNLTGIFSALNKTVEQVAFQDAHLRQLLLEYQEAVRDLRRDLSQNRVKACIHKQFNLLEGIGQTFPGVTENTLGAICGQVTSWPHLSIREALRRLYGFRSDYPGLGHAGNPVGALRELDLRDMIAMGALLSGFVPYLMHGVDIQLVYGR